MRIEGGIPHSCQIFLDEVFEDEHNINTFSLLILMLVHFDYCPSKLDSPLLSEVYQAIEFQICS
jgi:hypothetical protein